MDRYTPNLAPDSHLTTPGRYHLLPPILPPSLSPGLLQILLPVLHPSERDPEQLCRHKATDAGECREWGKVDDTLFRVLGWRPLHLLTVQSLLPRISLLPQVFELDQMGHEGSVIQEALAQKLGRSRVTVPQVG